MKKKVEKTGMFPKARWAVCGLSAVYALYSIVGFAGSRILSLKVRRGSISVGDYQSSLSALGLWLAIAATVALLIFFVASAAQTRGANRVAFILGAPSALGPLLSITASKLLFSTLGLPTMGAGSVLASTLGAVVMVMPAVTALFIIMCSRKNFKAVKWTAAVSWVLALAALLYPVYATVMALLIMPGDPGLRGMMEAGALILYLRGIVLALGMGALWLLGKKGLPEEKQKEAVS